MEMSNIWFTLLSCIFFMGLVGWVSYLKSKDDVSDSNGYFLAGRGLTGTFIAGSLLLTNLSAEQLIGLNGQAYRSNLSNMAWEVTAGFAVVIMALYLLPKYLGGAFTTLPEFLNTRYDEGVRRLSVLLFMLGYILVTIPSVLYSGALAILKLFDVPTMLGITYEESVWVIVWIVGIIGAIYAIFGGLKAVAISDTINGIGLLIIGVLVPVLGFIALGDGSLMEGVRKVVTANPEKLNAIGSNTDSVPFGTIFTGMILANLFYWGTNQYVIQRTLGAASLAEGQKGVIFSGYFKLAIPFFMMVPGLIAYQMYGEGMEPVDLAYPALVADVLPLFMSGFFLAVLLGAVLSSFNSLLNSAATMFALDIYKPLKKSATDKELIRISKIFGTIIALVSFFISPLLMNAPDGLWDLIRRFTGFFNIPIITIVLVGLLSKRIPALAAKVVIGFHVVTYYMLVWGLKQFFNTEITINFIYVYAILFVIEVAIMMVIGKMKPLKVPYTFKSNAQVSLAPWKYSLLLTVILLTLIVMTYIVFSPVGLAYGEEIVSPMFWPSMVGVLILSIIASVFSLKSWNRKYANYLTKQQSDLKEENKKLA